MEPPVMRAMKWEASRARSRTPASFPSFASRFTYRSTSSRTIGFPSVSFTPTPDRPLASTEEEARFVDIEAGPSNWMHGTAAPWPVAASPTPRPKYRRYRLKQRPAPQWARKILKWGMCSA
jgi:hypothetical protein